jgi:hypothetical protein
LPRRRRADGSRRTLNRPGFLAASFGVQEDGVKPKKIDPAIKERA